jgi:hypothetical protein
MSLDTTSNKLPVDNPFPMTHQRRYALELGGKTDSITTAGPGFIGIGLFQVDPLLVMVGHRNAGKNVPLEQLKVTVTDVLPSLPWNETWETTTTTWHAVGDSHHSTNHNDGDNNSQKSSTELVRETVCRASSCLTNNLRQCDHHEGLSKWSL